MAEILKCPVCGRVPKIKHYNNCYVHVAMVRCKPLFSKTHEEAISYGHYGSDTCKDAIDLWNARVKAYKERTE